MQKLHSKLGLLVVLSCLTLVMGLMTTGTASAHKKHKPLSVAPRIVLQVLPKTAHRMGHHYVARAMIYGMGFNDCNSCAGNNDDEDGCDSCDGSSSNASNNATCPSACGNTSNNYNVSNNTTCPSACGNTSNNYNASNNTTCPSACGNTSNNYNASNNTTCSDGCGNTSNNYNASNNATTCPSACGNNNAGHHTTCSQHAHSQTCGNVRHHTTCSDGCGNNHPSYNATTSYNSQCDCNTVNLLSNAQIYSQGMNLSQIPVNAFGEFHIAVLVELTPNTPKTNYNVWAVNRYDGQQSNVVSECTCQ